MSTLGKDEIQKQAIALVKDEVRKWTDAEVWITDKVRFRIRDLIRVCRKNYWGVFDKPNDRITGRKKIWQPLTEELCDSVAPKVKVPKKGIGTVAKKKEGNLTSEFLRFAAKEYLDNVDGFIDYDELQESNDLMKVIDGTSVKKIMGKGDKVKTKMVDLLNVYIDPHAQSIQAAHRFTERSIMSASDIKKTDWMNKDVKEVSGLHPTDEERMGDASSTVDGIEVFEMWGMIPESLITGKKEDTQEVPGQIVVSGIMNGVPKVHAIRRNTAKNILGESVKPYEEDRYIIVPGRWYGKGVAEKLIPMQLYLNIIVNIRINRSYVSQLGIFKIRKGSGITPDQFRKLSSNGAITVSSMDDLEQMVMEDASQASYSDEANIRNISQRLTSAFEVVTGEGLEASTPATNAVIQNKNALTTFTGIQQRGAQAVRRWLRQVVKRIADGWDPEKVVAVFGSDEKYNEMVDRVATYLVREELYKQSKAPSQEAIVREHTRIKNQLRNDGKMFVDNLKELVLDGQDVKVVVTNEDLDATVVSSQLMNMLQMVPELRVPIVKQIFDLMQLPIPDEFDQQLNGINDGIKSNIDNGQLSQQVLGDIAPQTQVRQ